jgi:hypothetical protein
VLRSIRVVESVLGCVLARREEEAERARRRPEGVCRKAEPMNKDEKDAYCRYLYINQHAAQLLAAMYAGGLRAEYSDSELRKRAIDEAGLLFDELKMQPAFK